MGTIWDGDVSFQGNMLLAFEGASSSMVQMNATSIILSMAASLYAFSPFSLLRMVSLDVGFLF